MTTKERHRIAYEKSIAETRCVKVHAGSYYYKGFHIYDVYDGYYPWNWQEVCDTSCVPARTKKECILNIDSYIEMHNCDIQLNKNSWFYN